MKIKTKYLESVKRKRKEQKDLLDNQIKDCIESESFKKLVEEIETDTIDNVSIHNQGYSIGKHELVKGVKTFLSDDDVLTLVKRELRKNKIVVVIKEYTTKNVLGMRATRVYLIPNKKLLKKWWEV